MEFPCPYCRQHIEILDEEIAELTEDVTVECPGCRKPFNIHAEREVEAPAVEKTVRVKLPPHGRPIAPPSQHTVHVTRPPRPL